jgi:hypothetical protein
MLHPDLDSLRSQYNQVLDNLEAGNLSYDDALSSVQAMSVVDGGGFVWLIDTASGGFLRAVPGEVPQEADPSEFVPARIPSAGSSPWASQQDLLRPPASPRPRGERQAPPQVDDDGEDESLSPMMRHRQAQQHSSRSKPQVAARLRTMKLPPLLDRNKRLLAIVLVLIVAFVVFSRFSKEDPAPTIEADTPVPTTPAPVPVETTPTLPAETVPSTAPAPLPLPTADELTALELGLISGNREKVASVVLEEASAQRTALYTARYYGYVATGLQIKFATPVLEEQRAFVSVSLVDSDSAEILATRKVRLRRAADGFWRFATHIDFES